MNQDEINKIMYQFLVSVAMRTDKESDFMNMPAPVGKELIDGRYYRAEIRGDIVVSRKLLLKGKAFIKAYSSRGRSDE